MESTEKEKFYREAIAEIKDRLKDTEKGVIIPRMATVVSVLKNTIPYFFWCGFYFAEEKEMLIGPYQGTSACANISYDGVCGKGAKKKETIIVADVHDFPGHIPCDPRSKSEIVVPLMEGETVIAILDVDSTEVNSFDETDKKFLEEIMPLLLE